jgi:hypothetical protein
MDTEVRFGVEYETLIKIKNSEMWNSKLSSATIQNASEINDNTTYKYKYKYNDYDNSQLVKRQTLTSFYNDIAQYFKNTTDYKNRVIPTFKRKFVNYYDFWDGWSKRNNTGTRGLSWEVTSDCSVVDYNTNNVEEVIQNIEIVSPPLSFEEFDFTVLKNVIDKVLPVPIPKRISTKGRPTLPPIAPPRHPPPLQGDPMFEYYGNATCSNHVHISIPCAPNEYAAFLIKLYMAWWYFEDVFFMLCGKKRRANGYTRSLDSHIRSTYNSVSETFFETMFNDGPDAVFSLTSLDNSEVFKLQDSNYLLVHSLFQNDRYCALNVNTNIETIECRLKEWSKTDDLIQWIKLLHAFYLSVRDHPGVWEYYADYPDKKLFLYLQKDRFISNTHIVKNSNNNTLDDDAFEHRYGLQNQLRLYKQCFDELCNFIRKDGTNDNEVNEVLTYWRNKLYENANMVDINSQVYALTQSSYPTQQGGSGTRTHVSYQNKTYKVFLTKANKKYINQNRKKVFLETIRNKYRYVTDRSREYRS